MNAFHLQDDINKITLTNPLRKYTDIIAQRYLLKCVDYENNYNDYVK